MLKKTILLVDDSATSRMKSRAVLGNLNYEVVSACDGKEGVEKAISLNPDLILMDVEMPRMTGTEACRLLRQNEGTKKTPIVLLTMRGEKNAVQNGFDSGCTEYLLKPITEEKLLSVLKKYLR